MDLSHIEMWHVYNIFASKTQGDEREQSCTVPKEVTTDDKGITIVYFFTFNMKHIIHIKYHKKRRLNLYRLQ